MYVHFNYRLFI